MEYNFENVTKNVKESWMDYFNQDESFLKTLSKIEKHRIKYQNKNQIFPKPDDVLNTFKYFELNQLNVVFLGQDPYIRSETHNNNIIPQAMGLSFSVPNKIKKLPPSLKNIFKELESDLDNFKYPKNGNLCKWVKKEKILLLNASLTVIEGMSGTHMKKWQKITDNLIKYISDNSENIVFILLGNFAKSKSKLINKDKHHIITGVHPSPLSAHRGFFGSKIFSKTNQYLESVNKKPINWNL